METEIIATVNMFGKDVHFCNCEVCQGFLKGNGDGIPVRMGRIVEGEKDSQDVTETIVDSMDA